MRRGKFLSFLLIVSIIISVNHFYVPQNVLAYSKIYDTEYEFDGRSYTDNPKLAERIEDVLAGRVKLFTDSDITCPVGGIIDDELHDVNNKTVGYHCYAYAHGVYFALFGEVVNLYFDDMPHSRIVFSNVDELTYSMFVSAGINVGSYIRTKPIDNKTENDPGHSMIVLAYDEETITIVSGNADGHGAVIYETYTWFEFNYYQLFGANRNVLAVVSPGDRLINDIYPPDISNVSMYNVDRLGFNISFEAYDYNGVTGVSIAALPVDNESDEYEYYPCIYDSNLNRYTFRYNYADHDTGEGMYNLSICATDVIGNESDCVFEMMAIKSIHSSGFNYQEPTDYGFYNGHLYIYYADVDNWLTAREYASSVGGNLVNIGSEEENDFVTELVSSNDGEACFIGYYRDSHSNWRWTDDAITEFENFSGEPRINDMYTSMIMEEDLNSVWVYNDGDSVQDSYTCGFVVELVSYDFTDEFYCDYNGNRYIFSDKKTTYDQAIMYAEMLGGHIVEITTAEENQFVCDFASQFDVENIIITYDEMSYSNWMYNSGYQPHTLMRLDKRYANNLGKWTTINLERTSSNKIGFVIEIEGGAEPVVTDIPTEVPTEEPVVEPTEIPSEIPSVTPSDEPTIVPTEEVTTVPSMSPDTLNTPTSEVTDIPTAEITIVVTPIVPTTPTVTVVPTISESGISQFAERLYTCALNRDSDSVGKQYWINELQNGRTGADVAYGFFFSEEVVSSNISNEEFINRLYRTFMGRDADEGGFNYWINQMSNGASRDDVFAGFVNSIEWANLCLQYGIISGGTAKPNIDIEPSEDVVAFATRLYTTCLGRDADSVGLNDWANRIANRQINGSEVARGFFFSSEFIDANISNEEYVLRLYRTFMNREADDAGYSYWITQMSNGASREDVFMGFANSTEWSEICRQCGINP